MTKANPIPMLDTRKAYDAGVCGYDGPRDPTEDGEGLIITGERASLTTIPSVKLVGPDGEVELCGRAEIQATIDALRWALVEREAS